MTRERGLTVSHDYDCITCRRERAGFACPACGETVPSLPKKRLTVSKFDVTEARKSTYIAGKVRRDHPELISNLRAACDHIDALEARIAVLVARNAKLERVRAAGLEIVLWYELDQSGEAGDALTEMLAALAACDDGEGV